MKKRKSEKPRTSKKIKQKKTSSIDGWGIILLIIGIALFLLREDIRIIGGIIALVGVIRIVYVLLKYK